MKIFSVCSLFSLLAFDLVKGIGNLTTGECLCATAATDVRETTDDSANSLASMDVGDCGKLNGGILTTDTHRWLELNYGGTRLGGRGTLGKILCDRWSSMGDMSNILSFAFPKGTLGPVKYSDCVCAMHAASGHNAPGATTPVIDEMKQDECAKINGGILTKDGYKWYELKYGDKEIWVAGLHLLVSDINACAVNNLGTVKGGDCVCTTADTAARTQPGLSAGVAKNLKSGDCGTINGGILTKDGHKWFELKVEDQLMWVSGEFLQKSGDSCSVAVPGGCPVIISRSQWNARSPKSISYQSHPAQYAFIHHAESGFCYDQATCASLVRGFQNFHMDSRGWADIGYNFLIGGDGSVFEGRGWDRIGAHTGNWNPVGFGFCFIGSFTSQSPTNIQMAKAQQLINCGVSLGKLSSNYILKGHRDMMSTSCPGDRLYSIIQGWPHY